MLSTKERKFDAVMIIMPVFSASIDNDDLHQPIRYCRSVNIHTFNPRTLIAKTVADIGSCTKPLPLSELLTE